MPVDCFGHARFLEQIFSATIVTKAPPPRADAAWSFGAAGRPNLHLARESDNRTQCKAPRLSAHAPLRAINFRIRGLVFGALIVHSGS